MSALKALTHLFLALVYLRDTPSTAQMKVDHFKFTHSKWISDTSVGDLDLGQPKLPQTVVAASEWPLCSFFSLDAFYSFLFSIGCPGIKETWLLLPNASPQLISSLPSSCSGRSVGNPDVMSTGEAAGSLANRISGRGKTYVALNLKEKCNKLINTS